MLFPSDSHPFLLHLTATNLEFFVGKLSIEFLLLSLYIYFGLPIKIELTFDAFEDGVFLQVICECISFAWIYYCLCFCGSLSEKIWILFYFSFDFRTIDNAFFSEEIYLWQVNQSVALVGVLLFIRVMGNLSSIFL